MSKTFFVCEPLTGKGMVKIIERKTSLDWAYFLEEIEVQHKKQIKLRW